MGPATNPGENFPPITDRRSVSEFRTPKYLTEGLEICLFPAPDPPARVRVTGSGAVWPGVQGVGEPEICVEGHVTLCLEALNRDGRRLTLRLGYGPALYLEDGRARDLEAGGTCVEGGGACAPPNWVRGLPYLEYGGVHDPGGHVTRRPGGM